MLFQGTFHLLDDTNELEATFEVAAGRVTISSAGQEIGRWPAKKIDLMHRRDGILLTVDGESLVVRPIDRYGFSDAVEAEVDEAPKRRFLRRRQKTARKPPVTVPVEAPATPDRVPAQPAAKSRRNAPLPPVEPPQPSAWPFDGREDRSSDGLGPAAASETIPLADAIESAKANPLPGRFVEASTPVPIDLTKEIFGEPTAEPSPKGPGLASRLAEQWWSVPAGARRAGVVLAVGAVLTLLIPEVVATVLVLTGLAACLAGGAGMADPSYTRKLPPALSDSRLLIGGGVMLVVGFLIGLPSL